jgi:hypothetical protein
MFTKENCPGGFREGLAASLTLVALYPTGRFADLFKVRLRLIALQLTVIRAYCVWLKSLVRASFSILSPSG